MKRTSQKLCGHLKDESNLVQAELATLPDDLGGLHLAEAALKLRDAIAAARQAWNLIETAKAQRVEAVEQGGFSDGDDAA